jgi:hypothetical protein
MVNPALGKRAIPDIMIELIAYWSVPQSRQSWQWLSDIYTKLLRASSPLGKKVENHCVK